MSICEELKSIPDQREQFAFKGKGEHISEVNIPNITYPNQYINIAIPAVSRDHLNVPDTVKIKFNLDIDSIKDLVSVTMKVEDK